MFKSKRGQSNGLVTGLVFGIASLVIAVIIAFVIVSTLTDANLLEDNRVTSTVTNETSWLNATVYTLDNVATNNLNYAITALWANTSTDYELIPSANYTLSSAGVITRAGAEDYDDALVSYTYVTKTNEEVSTDTLSGNFTDGVDNVSSKIPTVLLVAAIVLILGVLVLLVAAWQRMNIGGIGSGGI